jgi:hypothetical protein
MRRQRWARSATQRRSRISTWAHERASVEPVARPLTKSKRRTLHATVQVTRIEEWFVDAQSAEEARALLENGGGHRGQVGECVHFEIDKLDD